MLKNFRAAAAALVVVFMPATAEYQRANPGKSFYVVGHTDSKGTFSYNSKLSSDRALAVADALEGKKIDGSNLSRSS